jgi:hypothetical protein
MAGSNSGYLCSRPVASFNQPLEVTDLFRLGSIPGVLFRLVSQVPGPARPCTFDCSHGPIQKFFFEMDQPSRTLSTESVTGGFITSSIPAEVWDGHKANILIQYQDKRRSLKDTMAHMRKHYLFHARFE